MKYIYGPLHSRRLGFSLGLTLTPHKICSFDCAYCQLGSTTLKTAERKEYISATEVLEELKSWLAHHPDEARQLNYITFSGSGEPTLNINLGRLIQEIKQLTPVPVAVITNASLLADAALRREILSADLIVPSLDAVTPKAFEKIDRPQPGVKIEEIIAGLIALRKEFRGKLWLEVMLVKGINDDLRQIKKLKEAVEQINPDKIQLNSPVRTTAEPGISCLDKAKLKKIAGILGEKAQIL
jgi:wyosine [tRNA(Phe)-imidazoG37] synthetase (radical SAM superfamily)